MVAYHVEMQFVLRTVTEVENGTISLTKREILRAMLHRVPSSPLRAIMPVPPI